MIWMIRRATCSSPSETGRGLHLRGWNAGDAGDASAREDLLRDQQQAVVAGREGKVKTPGVTGEKLRFEGVGD